jgi:creatinine amidohydrolase/Fe(II)-dependent formamide hydrolase-like protein
MILPPIYYGVSSYAVGGPEKNTINMDVDVFESYIYNILKSLFKSGFRRNICILVFHQGEDFLPTALACMKAAKKLTFEYLEETDGYGWWGKNDNAEFYENLKGEDNPWNWVRVFNGASSPEKYPGDHAGRYECGLLEALFPGSIKLERLEGCDDWFAQSAREMTVAQGHETKKKILRNILKALSEGTSGY